MVIHNNSQNYNHFAADKCGIIVDKTGKYKETTYYISVTEFDGDYLDSSGNGRHLQNFGTNFSEGLRNQAAEFGSGKYLKLAGNSSGTIKAISIRIYPTSNSAEQMYFYLSKFGSFIN